MLAQNQVEKLGLNPDVDYLPILIRMRDLSRLGEVSILDYAKQFAENSMSVKSLPEGFFEYWLEDGRALILLDGLDEVAEESKRYKVVQRIENFLGQFQRNIAIITSRPAGYKRDFFRTEEFPHYELLAFDDRKVEEFVNRWYDSRFQDKAEAERRKESLRKALNNNERIKLLAHMRRSAANALVKLNQVSDPVVNTLMKLLSDDHNYLRYGAAEVLGELGKKSDRILPLIEQWLKENQDAENVGNAIDVLWDIVAAQ